MSEGNFEVLPVGTIEELRMLRQFANSMIELNSDRGIPVPYEMSTKILELNRFYNHHVETYPV